jgi:hypothetical protein
MVGRVPVGSTFELKLEVRPMAVQAVETTLVVQFRGGKKTSLPVAFDSALPVIKVLQQEFNFGGVYLGSNHRLPLSIENASATPAVCFCDLSKFSIFKLEVGSELLAFDEFDEQPITEKPADRMPSANSNLSGNRLMMQLKGMAKPERMERKTGSLISLGSRAMVDPELENLYKFVVPPNTTVHLKLCFSPHKIGNYAYELPLSLVGFARIPSLARAVIAQCLKPRLAMSSSLVEFNECTVIKDKKSPFAYARTSCTHTHSHVRTYAHSHVRTQVPRGDHASERRSQHAGLGARHVGDRQGRHICD